MGPHPNKPILRTSQTRSMPLLMLPLANGTYLDPSLSIGSVVACLCNVRRIMYTIVLEPHLRSGRR